MGTHLLFLYAPADGPCTLCGRRGHLLASCCFQMHAGSRKAAYTGIELCPGCLRREGAGVVRKVMRWARRDLLASCGKPATRLDRENLRDTREACDELVALADRGHYQLPPPLVARWLASKK